MLAVSLSARVYVKLPSSSSPARRDTLRSLFSLNVTHPALKREDRLGKDPFAGFGTVVEDITESGYTKNQPILLGPF